MKRKKSSGVNGDRTRTSWVEGHRLNHSSSQTGYQYEENYVKMKLGQNGHNFILDIACYICTYLGTYFVLL